MVTDSTMIYKMILKLLFELFFFQIFFNYFYKDFTKIFELFFFQIFLQLFLQWFLNWLKTIIIFISMSANLVQTCGVICHLLDIYTIIVSLFWLYTCMKTVADCKFVLPCVGIICACSIVLPFRFVLSFIESPSCIT